MAGQYELTNFLERSDKSPIGDGTYGVTLEKAETVNNLEKRTFVRDYSLVLIHRLDIYPFPWFLFHTRMFDACKAKLLTHDPYRADHTHEITKQHEIFGIRVKYRRTELYYKRRNVNGVRSEPALKIRNRD